MRLRPSFLLIPALATMAFIGGPVPGHTQGAAVTAPPGLNMTTAQQARAKTLQQKFVQKLTALQANKSLTPAQKASQEQTLAKAHDTEMMGILTAAQKAQVMSQRKDASSKQQAFLQAHGSELKAGQALATKLTKSLTPAQKAQLGAIQKQATQQYQALAANKSLSQQAKMQQMQSLSQQAQAKINTILTPAQQADYTKMQQMQKRLMQEAGQQPH